MIWANLNVLMYDFALIMSFFKWVWLIHRIAVWWLMNGILTYFFLFVRSWRFTFYITSFFTGLAVLYDVSIQAVLLALLPSQCLQERQGLLSNMSFQTFLQRFSHHISLCPLHSTLMRPQTYWTMLILKTQTQTQEVSSSGRAEDNGDCVKIHFCGVGDGTHGGCRACLFVVSNTCLRQKLRLPLEHGLQFNNFLY